MLTSPQPCQEPGPKLISSPAHLGYGHRHSLHCWYNILLDPNMLPSRSYQRTRGSEVAVIMVSVQMSHLQLCWGRLNEPFRSFSICVSLCLSIFLFVCSSCLLILSFATPFHHIASSVSSTIPWIPPFLLALVLITPGQWLTNEMGRILGVILGGT